MRWYERFSKRDWRLFVVFQTTAILFAATTPCLILWSSIPKGVQALPAALASGRSRACRHVPLAPEQEPVRVHAEALKSERVLYETRTPPRYAPDLTEDEALAAFVGRIEEISMTEVSEWRTEFSRAS